MKQITELNISALAFTPSEHKFNENNLRVCLIEQPLLTGTGDFRSQTYVWMIKCKTVKEIPEVLGVEIVELKKIVKTSKKEKVKASFQRQVDYFEKIKSDILRKSELPLAPKELVAIFCNHGIIEQGQSAILLSGITSIAEN